MSLLPMRQVAQSLRHPGAVGHSRPGHLRGESPRAAAQQVKDRNELPVFHDFPAKHWHRPCIADSGPIPQGGRSHGPPRPARPAQSHHSTGGT